VAPGTHPVLTGARIVLLDADGVFLRLPAAKELECLELFEDFLRESDFADVQVVAAGQWKSHIGLEGVRKLFADDLGERFVDVTPDIDGSDGFRSHVEIHAWLAAHPEIADYVVLESGHFWPRLPALESAVFVDPGRGVLGSLEVEALARHFRSSW